MGLRGRHRGLIRGPGAVDAEGDADLADGEVNVDGAADVEPDADALGGDESGDGTVIDDVHDADDATGGLGDR